MHLVDTEVCVDALRGVQTVIDALETLEAEGPLAVAAVTAHELWQGAFGAGQPDKAVRAVERFLAAFEVLPYDEAVARRGGQVAATLRAAGRPIGDLDTMIAATALHHTVPLVTRNVRHFHRVRGLNARAP